MAEGKDDALVAEMNAASPEKVLRQSNGGRRAAQDSARAAPTRLCGQAAFRPAIERNRPKRRREIESKAAKTLVETLILGTFSASERPDYR